MGLGRWEEKKEDNVYVTDISLDQGHLSELELGPGKEIRCWEIGPVFSRLRG